MGNHRFSLYNSPAKEYNDPTTSKGAPDAVIAEGKGVQSPCESVTVKPP